MTAADWNQLLLGVNGVISTAGLVAVHVIRELRRRPENIPPPLVVRATTPAGSLPQPKGPNQ